MMNIHYNGKQWTIQRRYSHFAKLDYKLKLEGYFVGYDLPTKVVFGNLYPSVLDHRRKELNKYLKMLSSTLSSDNTYLREFFDVDENMLKIALKQSRRMSDVYRSDNILQIFKRASQLMINGNDPRRPVQRNRREDYYRQHQGSNSFSGRPRSAGPSNSANSHGNSFSSSSTPPRNISKLIKQKNKPPPFPNAHKNGPNNSNTYSSLQESTRHRDSFSSNTTDSLNNEPWHESAIMSALKDDFMSQSSFSSPSECDSPTTLPIPMILYDQSSSTAELEEIDYTLRKDYISNVNSCFRQKSDDGTWTETSTMTKVIHILSSPPPIALTKHLTDMTSIANLIKQQLSISLGEEDVFVTPGAMWEDRYKTATSALTPPPKKPAYDRPRHRESTVALRLRFTQADAPSNLSPHLVKHLL